MAPAVGGIVEYRLNQELASYVWAYHIEFMFVSPSERLTLMLIVLNVHDKKDLKLQLIINLFMLQK